MKKHKIGASYNLFDGEELLEESVRSIRPFVDYIAVITQNISNFGEQYNGGTNEAFRLQELGLIDTVIVHTPETPYDVLDSGTKNELIKRNLGLTTLRNANCTHILQMDCDEMYLAEQISECIEEVVECDYDTSFCQMATYYKTPSYQLFPKETYYVPFLAKIKPNIKYEIRDNYPVLIDRTRMLPFGNGLVFGRDELEMQHYSFVRKDIERKFRNSSSRFPKEDVDDCIKVFKEWSGGSAILLGKRVFQTKKVKPLIDLQWLK